MEVLGPRPEKRSLAGFFVRNAFLYLMHGITISTNQASQDFYYLDLSSKSKTWTSLPINGLNNLSHPLPYASRFVETNDAAYVLTGWTGTELTNASYKLSFALDGRSLEVTVLNHNYFSPSPRQHLSAVHIGDKIYIFGGSLSSGTL